MNQTIKTASVAIIAVALFSLAVMEFISFNEERRQPKANPLVEGPIIQNGIDETNEGAIKFTMDPTSIEFEESEFDFGQVTLGEQVSHVFTFTNTGDKPLLISKAKGSCGCTVPSWPQRPIAPGATGELLVNFDSEKGGVGNQAKTVTVTANTNPQKTTVTIKAQVVQAGNESAGIQ